MEANVPAPLPLAERVAAVINSPGSLTHYVWDSAESQRSWELNNVAISFDRAYRGHLSGNHPLSPLCFLACLDDWNHVSSVIASLVELEEECTIELADAVGSSTPSGASLRQLASNVMGIRVELRLDMQGGSVPSAV